MKNMSVGKKILVGFMMIIAMIGVILAMTVITSLTRNEDLRSVEKMSELQQDANVLLYNFNLARVEIRTVFTSIDAEEEYNIALEYLDTCVATLDLMEGLSAELDGYMAEDIDALREMFDGVRAGVVNVGDNDEKVNAAIAVLQENGSLMTTSASELFERVSSLTLNIGAGDAAAGMERVEKVVIPANALQAAVEDVHVLSRAFTLNQDVALVPEMTAGLDSVASQAAALRAILTTDEARVAIDTVTTAVEGFRSSIEEVQTTVDQSNGEIATARETFLQLSERVLQYVEKVAADSNALSAGVIDTSMMTMFIMIGVSVVAVVFAVVVATLLGRVITRPLNKMKDVMLQAGETGNLRFSEEVQADVKREAQARDEIGQSLLAFTKFIDHIVNMSGILGRVADKDLTVDVTPLGPDDTMGVSLQQMLENLNNMFAEINSISAQVATASNEIAMGAQSLAQGSTEQASTVQEVSASINEINEQMNTSNETAMQAAQASVEMSQVASDDNGKMQHMMSSMHEINEASQAIGQVIKVIDDIAFQTNILALNAAVEAARAGEHGKGFAVVADEVRNLAGKSADAAKETASLISSNIEKTEQGLSYTQETADSLTRIMEGIQGTSDSLQLVAEQSEGAKAATSQVNLAIDQVAVVVQQNSATSEESAAASEEMSSQAQVLQQLVAQFKLKGNMAGPRPIGPPPDSVEADSPTGGEAADNTVLF